MLAQLTEKYPQSVLLVGCQPQEIDDFGGSLRPVVRTALEDAVALGVDRLRAWGAKPVPRLAPPGGDEVVTVRTLAIEGYEAGRPSAEQACRIGDERFIAQR